MPPNEQNDEVSSLEKLRERLYTPNTNTNFQEPTLSRAPTPPATSSWRPPPPPPPRPRRKPMSRVVLFLFGALAFFILAGLASFLFLYLGTRSVSNDNITITAVPNPTSIASGSVVQLVITIKNHNPTALINTDISLDFPDGTRTAEDVTQPLVRYADTLGAIPAGGTVTRTISAVLFGSVNQTVTVPVTFQYRTTGSNALFTKEQKLTLTITSAPLTITANTVSTVASGQSFAFSVAVRSNASTVLNNIGVVATYPPGFTASHTSDGPANTQFFPIGTLQPGEEKDFVIQGALSGSNNDQRVFQFTVGTAKDDGSATLAVAYASQQTQVAISKPFLAVSLSVNNSNANPVIVSADQPITSAVSWTNSLSSAITNGKVSIKFSGNALDPTSVTTANGYYDSTNTTLLFDGQSELSLQSLNPGDNGNGSFGFSTKSGTALMALRNPTIQLTVSVAGQHSGIGNSETILNTLTQTIQIATDLKLISTVVHTIGPFPNSGPWPPKANTPTTYTILWNITNTVNSVGGASVSAILPSYVTFTGKINPSDSSVTYDDTSRTVTWKVGDVQPGTVSKPLQAAFQVSILPSVSQVGTAPILIGNQTLTGTDRFTGTQVGTISPALSTQTPTDPAYQIQFGNVGN
ncbi:hypothetical protein H0X32_02425 [Patescibacteria group bacterium]|nr:hypothetical protein [Patescibacteria group bacterium]